MSVSWINSKTEICNLALGMVGDMRINAYEDTDDLNSRLCRDYYDQTRDTLLRSTPWAFATKRAQLSELSPAPLFGEDNQFILPADFIRMISLNDHYAEAVTGTFRIEMVGEVKVLVTDEDGADIRYVFRNDTPSTYDAIFVRAMASQLASALAFPITGDARLTEMLHVKAERDLSAATHENANEAKRVIKSFAGDSGLVKARRSSNIG